MRYGKERRNGAGAYLQSEQRLRFFVSIVAVQKSHFAVPMVEEQM